MCKDCLLIFPANFQRVTGSICGIQKPWVSSPIFVLYNTTRAMKTTKSIVSLCSAASRAHENERVLSSSDVRNRVRIDRRFSRWLAITVVTRAIGCFLSHSAGHFRLRAGAHPPALRVFAFDLLSPQRQEKSAANTRAQRKRLAISCIPLALLALPSDLRLPYFVLPFFAFPFYPPCLHPAAHSPTHSPARSPPVFLPWCVFRSRLLFPSFGLAAPAFRFSNKNKENVFAISRTEEYARLFGE